MVARTVVWLASALVVVSGCGDDGMVPGPDAGGGDGALPDGGMDAGMPGDDGGGGPDAAVPDGSMPDGEGVDAPVADAGMPAPLGGCFMDPPAGAELPAAVPSYSGGTCPMLMPGMNTIRSGSADREVLLVVPEDYDGTTRLPLIFMWHWLGGDAMAFYERGEVQDGANRKHFLAAIMQEKGDLLDKWPWSPLSGAARTDEELRYFDDVLACVYEQYAVNTSCVSSVGVSAGALWTAQLAPRRSRYLSSFVSLSGGTGGLLVKPWTPAEHAMPALVLWGGPSDFCGVQFQDASRDMEMGLVDGGHFILECVHNCGHSVPPFEAPGGMPTFSAMWDFVIDHPYWLPDGVSPYTTSGLPVSVPEWCAIGAGSATIRTGACGPDECM